MEGFCLFIGLHFCTSWFHHTALTIANLWYFEINEKFVSFFFKGIRALWSLRFF